MKGWTTEEERNKNGKRERRNVKFNNDILWIVDY